MTMAPSFETFDITGFAALSGAARILIMPHPDQEPPCRTN
ncbi:hypothetical protein Atep_00840 [Allochromatium tepidum]|uniref:Uncharacterized protein n=2 Tax=Allochromatium tepidum TaxID=553982 RepID=A0ABM7QI28_9GAMM|nr:hypothetical protein Atep_00840 [Allochromatium tepidum]